MRLLRPYLGMRKMVDPRQWSRAALRAASTTFYPLLSTGVIAKPYIQKDTRDRRDNRDTRDDWDSIRNDDGISINSQYG